MSLNPKAMFRKAALIAVVGGPMLAAFPAAAQDALNNTQCRDARATVVALLKEYRGKMSAPLARSLAKFSDSCSLETSFERIPGTADDEAFGKLRLMIHAIRKTAELTK